MSLLPAIPHSSVSFRVPQLKHIFNTLLTTLKGYYLLNLPPKHTFQTPKYTKLTIRLFNNLLSGQVKQ